MACESQWGDLLPVKLEENDELRFNSDSEESTENNTGTKLSWKMLTKYHTAVKMFQQKIFVVWYKDSSNSCWTEYLQEQQNYKSCFKDERRLQWRLTKFLFIVYYRWCLNMTNIKSVKTKCLGLFVASYLSINLRILLLPLKNIKSLSTNFRAIQNLYTVD